MRAAHSNNSGRYAKFYCIKIALKRGSFEMFKKMKEILIEEINALEIQGLHVNNLNLLNGFYVNLEYTLKNKQSVKLLEDNRVYWEN